MKFRLIVGIIAGMFLWMGFIHQPEYRVNQEGCAGSGCHIQKKGLFSLHKMANLKVSVRAHGIARQAPVGAQLLDARGRIIDYQEPGYSREISLNAPQPGHYRVLIGYKLDQPYWDSLSVTLTPSIINIPSSRYGTATFKLFPIHPRKVRQAAVLQFILPEKRQVEVGVYTPVGKKIGTIFSGFLAKGIHEIYWKARDQYLHPLEPGQYLIELRAGRDRQVQSLLVVQ